MSDYRDRIDDLAATAREDRRAFDPPEEPPDRDRAVAYLREGVGEVVSVYVEARTGEFAPLDEAEMDGLESALNDWLELYARCHGERIEADLSVREVAETVVMDTHDLADAAQILTGVPERQSDVAWSARSD